MFIVDNWDVYTCIIYIYSFDVWAYLALIMNSY